MVALGTIVCIVYAIGVVIAVALTDARPAARIALALVWPLGPIAFLVTISVLVVAAMIAFPVFGAVAATAAALIWWGLGD
jgi:hypothetical protein